MLTGVLYANAAAQLMKMIYVSSAHQPIGQAAEFKFESKFEPLLVIWQSLPKAVPKDNRRFREQNQTREAYFPSGSIIPSQAKNNWFSRFSRREKSDKIFQNPSTLKGINIQRPAFKDTPARTSKKVQRSQQGNLSSNSKESFEFLLN